MTAFLVIFFLIYGAWNFYVFMKARSALHPGPAASLIMIGFLLVMVASPVIVRMSERSGHEGFATLTAYLGYAWLGLVFLFVSTSFLLDAYHFLLRASGLILKRDFSPLSVSARKAFLVPLGIAVMIAVYGYFEAAQIRTEHVILRTSKLPAGVERLRIAQISDVHLGLIVGAERLKRILREVRSAQPDILVSTGDLVDAEICGVKGFAELLAELRPRYGKYGVTGNHEFYAGLPHALACSGQAGLTMLRGKALTVGGLISIAGVDDPAARSFGLGVAASEKDILSALPPGVFTVLLKHRPLIDRDSRGLFDLQLSGHTHKGQIFPFSLVTRMYYPVHAGLQRLSDGSHLYVSRGAGTWGPPIRFLSPPEVTVIDLVRENNHAAQ